MNWYVKYEGTGEIAGPMSKGEALHRSVAADAMVFSENIFSPKFVTSEEVETLLTEMRSAHQKLGGREEMLKKLMGRSIDAITLLSHEKPDPTSKEVASLISELQGLRESLEIIRQGEDDAVGTLLGQVMDALVLLSREKPDPTSEETAALITDLETIESVWSDKTEPGEEADVARRAIATITLLSREKVVRGDIEGGVLDLTEVSEGILIDIRDRDCEGTDEDDNVEEDERGSYFQAGE